MNYTIRACIVAVLLATADEAAAQHIINLRSQVRQLVAVARDLGAWDDLALQAQVGRLDAHISGLWRMTQRGATSPSTRCTTTPCAKKCTITLTAWPIASGACCA